MVDKLYDLSEVIGFTSERPEFRNEYIYTVNEIEIDSIDDCYVIRDNSSIIRAVMFFNPIVKDISLLLSNVPGYGEELIEFIKNKYDEINLFCKENLVPYYENLDFHVIEYGKYCEMKYIKDNDEIY